MKERWYLHEHGLENGPLGNSHGYHISNNPANDDTIDDIEGYRLIVWEQISHEEGQRIVAAHNACLGIPTDILTVISAFGGMSQDRAVRALLQSHAHMAETLHALCNIVTTEHESKESFIGRVRCILGGSVDVVADAIRKAKSI